MKSEKQNHFLPVEFLAVLPLMVLIAKPYALGLAATLALSFFWMEAFLLAPLWRWIPKKGKIFARLAILGAAAQLAVHFLNLHPFWILAVLLLSETAEENKRALAVLKKGILFYFFSTSLVFFHWAFRFSSLDVKNPAVLLFAGTYALILLPKRESFLKTADFWNSLRKIAELFLQTSIALCLEWSIENFLPQAAVFRIFNLLLIAGLTSSVRKTRDDFIFFVFALSSFFLPFKAPQALGGVLLALSGFCISIWILQVLALGLREKMFLSPLAKSVLFPWSWLLFFASILLASEGWLGKFTTSYALNWDLLFPV